MQRSDRIDLAHRSAQDEPRQLLHASGRRGDGAGHVERIRDVRTRDADVVEGTAEGRIQRRSGSGRVDDDRDRLTPGAPVLLIVGGADHQVLELNRMAASDLSDLAQIVVIPGASHLFEEPGALDEVARLARDWFERHLFPAAQRASG